MDIPTPTGQTPQPPAPKFDPNAAHQQKPKLRMVRGFPAKVGEQQVIGLADARQVTDRIILLPPAAQFILPHLNGEKALDEVVSGVGRIPVELAKAREKLWTPEKEKGGSGMKIWTPGSEERP